MKFVLQHLLGIEGSGLSGDVGLGLTFSPWGLVVGMLGLGVVVYLRFGRPRARAGWWAAAIYGGGLVALAAGLLAQLDLRLGDRLMLKWQWNWPGWVGVLVGLTSAGYVLAVYRREGGPGPVRVVLAWLRIGLLVLLLALIWQPVLVLQQTRKEPSELLLLIDDSASVAAADRFVVPEELRHNARAAGLGARAQAAELSDALAGKSRWELARQVLLGDNGARLKALGARNELALFTFSATAEPRGRADDEAQIPELLAFLADHQPRGRATNLAASIREALKQSTGRRVAGLVVVSDGRSTAAEDLAEAVDAARKRSLPIHTVLLGSSAPPKDLWLGPVYSEQNVFVKDVVSFRSRLQARGFTAPVRCRVELFESGNEVPLAGQTVELAGGVGQIPVELRYKPPHPGRIRYRLRVEPHPEEVQTSNNQRAVEINVVDQNLRVLYVEGYPRFEYRYLKNTLIREQTVRVSCLLLSADQEFPQEGNDPIRRFPETPEELARYDVILFGDVNPYDPYLSQPQLEMVVDLVKDRGAGFAMIAGPRYAPKAYIGTPIEKLLPVVIDARQSYRPEGTLTTPFNPMLTAEGRSSPLFRIEEDPASSLEAFQRLPGLYWFARTSGLKPAAEALAVHPTVEVLTGAAPIVAVGRFGAGRTLFQAIDSTWRWRYHTGEVYFDTYWLQLVRFLARNKVLGQGRAFTLSTDRRSYRLGESVTVQLEVLDPTSLARLAQPVNAVLSDAAGKTVGRIELTRSGAQASTFRGSFVPASEGSVTISVVGLGEPPEGLSETVQVTAPDLEGRELAADHAALRELSKQTGGRAVYLDELDELARSIGSRSQLIPDDRTWPIWDTRLALLLLSLIIVGEWICRKAYNMT